MSKTIKRLLATILVCFSFVNSAPLSGFISLDLPTLFSEKASAYTSSGDYGYTLNNGVATITKYLGNDTSIVVPAQIDGYAVEVVDLFDDFDYDVTSVVFSEGIKTIKGTCCFYWTKVVSFRIPASVSEIGEGLFTWSDTLKYIYIDSANPFYTVSSNVLYNKDKTILIKYPACKTGTSYTIPNSVSRIGSDAFYHSRYLKDIVIPDSVKEIGGSAFLSSSVTNITIPDDPYITNCGNPFSNSGYANNKSNWENGCLYLGRMLLKIDADKTGNVNVKDGTVVICSSAAQAGSISSITLPDSLEEIGSSAFYGCKIKTVNWSKGLKRIGMDAFSYSALSGNVTLPQGLLEIGIRAFEYTNITSLEIPGSVMEINYLGTCNSLQKVILNEGTQIIGHSFEYCRGINTIILPKSLTTIEPFAFKGSSSSTKITAYYAGEKSDWQKVSIGRDNYRITNATMVYGYKYTYFDGGYHYQLDNNEAIIVGHDSSISGNITLPDTLGGYPVTGIADGAIGETITNINIPVGISYISEKAFINAKKLSMISVVSDSEYYCADAHGVLYNKNQSVLIAYPAASVLPTYCIPKTVESFSASAFENCKNLYNLSVSPLNDYLSNDKFGVIFDRYQVRLIYYPRYNSRTKYKVPNTVINIAEYAFSGASNLKELTIPESVKNIGENALNISALQDIYYDGSEDDWDVIPKARCGLPTFVNVHFGKASSYNLNEEEYINQHFSFAGSNSMGDKFGFYNAVWEDAPNKWLKIEAAYMNGIIQDIGEIMKFKFDDLTISGDYYDLYLTDLILRLNDAKSKDDIELQHKKLNEGLGLFKNLLRTSDQWNESTINEFEIENLFTKEAYKLSDETRRVLNEVLGDTFKNHEDEIENTFGNMDMFTSVFGRISDVVDFVNYAVSICNAYSVISYYKETNGEIFNILYAAANRMDNEKQAEWFRNAIDKYKYYALSDSTIQSALLETSLDGAFLLYDLTLKDALKNVFFNAAAKVCSCSKGLVAFKAFIISTTYNLTYSCLDKLLKLSDKSDTICIMYHISPVEKALCYEEKLYGAYLINDRNLTNAVNYDLAFRILKETNAYLYQTAYNYCSYINDTDGMALISSNASFWKTIHCHNGNTSYVDSKYSGVHCPVDVYMYDLTGNTVLQIVNEEIVSCNDEITVLVANGKKSFVYPADKDYSIEIVPRDNGNMSYFVSEIDDGVITRNVAFYDLPLTKDADYTGDIPQPLGIDSKFYALKLNEDNILCDYDSMASSCENSHQFGEWITKTVATTCCDGLLVRVCAECGKQETKLVPAEHPNVEFRNTIAATCASTGYEGDIYCSDCGIYLGKGKGTDKTNEHSFTEKYEAVNEESHYAYCICDERIAEDHVWEKSLNTVPAACTDNGKTVTCCALCGFEKTTIIPATGHSDKDNDGICDECGTNIGGNGTYESNCVCGQHHTGPFAGLIKFFQKIIYFFRNLFK